MMPPLSVHLIDGTYELFRQFYGRRRFENARPAPFGAVAGVLHSILEMIEKGATHIGVATDHVIESFRNGLWPGYKTGAGIERALRAQFTPLEQALGAMGVVVWPMIELEADDALASAARAAAADKKVQQVCIWTPDKDLARPAQHLDDSIAAYTLREVLVRRPDADLLHFLVRCSGARGRGESIVGFQFDHRPDDHTHGAQRLLQRNELSPQCTLDSLASLVARPESVTKRFDDVIGRDANMGRALFDHLQDRVQHARHRAQGRWVRFFEASPAVELAIKFVRPVDQVDR